NRRRSSACPPRAAVSNVSRTWIALPSILAIDLPARSSLLLVLQQHRRPQRSRPRRHPPSVSQHHPRQPRPPLRPAAIRRCPQQQLTMPTYHSITDQIFTVSQFFLTEECEAYIQLAESIGFEE